jgi:DNA invertase Pin-like site-specific DNA recombinase
MTPQPRLLSILVAVNLRLGMPDSRALDHARGTVDLLGEHFSGESLYVGRPPRPNNDPQVAALRAKGQSVRRIARALGMSRSAVQRSLERQGLTGTVPLSGVNVDARAHDPRVAR